MRDTLRYISFAEGTNQVKMHPRGLITIIIIVIIIIIIIVIITIIIIIISSSSSSSSSSIITNTPRSENRISVTSSQHRGKTSTHAPV